MRNPVWAVLALALSSGCPAPGPGSDGGAPIEPIFVDGGGGCEVLTLMNARCTSCHGAMLQNGAPVSFTSLASLRAPSSRNPAQSNAERCLARMQDGELPMPPPPEARASTEEVALLKGWVASGMPPCTSADGGTVGEDAGTGPTSPNLIPQNELFECKGLSSNAPARIRRLNRWQWTRNVGGAVTRSWTGFSYYDNPFDPSPGEPYSTYATDETLDEASIELFLPIVAEAGPPWAGPYTGSNRLERLRLDVTLRCMYQQVKPSAACVRHYLEEFLEHGVYFRKPTPAEVDRLVAFTNTVLAAEPTPDAGALEPIRTASITRISNAAWLTVGAMFRDELQPTLSAQQLSQQLAYAVGSRAPGATPTWVFPNHSAGLEGHYADIYGAGEDGGIRNDATALSLWLANVGGTDPTRFDLIQDYGVNRRNARGEFWLADGPANFFREWLGYTTVPDIFKERPEALSKYDDGNPSGYRPQLSSYSNLMSGYYGSEPTLIQQMDDLIARVVVADSKVLETLLTTRQFYLAANVNGGSSANAIGYTGQIYNTMQTINQTRAERWVMLPAAERAGVLTHPAWLGSHGNNFEDDPSIVHRGKWVRENLLCGYVPPLSSVRVMAKVGDHAPDKSARARLDDATGKQECQGCHRLMNPLGYPFEIYNHAGYLRLKDHAPDGGFGPPDGTASLSGLPDPALDGPVRDAVELSEKLSKSAHVKRCFIRHAFRYYMGRDENRNDACTLAKMESAYDQNNGSFFKMVGALVTSDTWKTRRAPEAGE